MTTEKKLLEDIKTLCCSSGFSICTAESITSGWLCAKLADLPGASKFLKGGIIAYQDDIKEALLKIEKETLLQETAVSPAVAKSMAESVLDVFNANISIATTGYAGPKIAEEPVGLVYIAVSHRKKGEIKTTTKEFNFSGSRNEIRYKTVQTALKLLWKTIIQIK